jgi:hypothetical protein
MISVYAVITLSLDQTQQLVANSSPELLNFWNS